MAFDNRVLTGLPPASLLRLQPRLELVRLERGRTLYAMGSPIRDLYFVTEGLVSLLALTPDGATLELATVGAEGFLGLPVVLGNPQAPYQATVQIGGAALRVAADVFSAELRDNAVLRAACLQYTDRALADIAQAAVCHHFHALPDRLCRWLLKASDCVQQDSFEVTQETLAEVMGVHRNAIGIAAIDLERAEAVRCARGRIRILNRRRLELSACACYRAALDEFVLTPPPGDPLASSARRKSAREMHGTGHSPDPGRRLSA